MPTRDRNQPGPKARPGVNEEPAEEAPETAEDAFDAAPPPQEGGDTPETAEEERIKERATLADPA